MATDYEVELERAKARVRETNYTNRDAWAAQWEAERRLAQSTGGPWAELLDLGPKWDAGAPLPHILTGSGTCILVCHAFEPDPAWDGTYVNVVSPSDAPPSSLLVYTFRRVHSIKFGGPNDEVMHGHPFSGRGLVPYGAHIIHDSPWVAEEEQINSVHPHHRAEAYRELRHYFFAFHDETFEALARDVEVRAVMSTMGVQLQEAVRLITYDADQAASDLAAVGTAWRVRSLPLLVASDGRRKQGYRVDTHDAEIPVLAVGEGGPMDGTVLGDDAAPEFEVTTADGARWRYVRTDALAGIPARRLYRCIGRF